MTGVRGMLAEYIRSPGNPDGCLRGDISDYVEPFEPCIDEVEAKFTNEREYLQKLL